MTEQEQMVMAPVVDPVGSTQAAGLRCVNDSGPGIRRKRAGKNFSYLSAPSRSWMI